MKYKVSNTSFFLLFSVVIFCTLHSCTQDVYKTSETVQLSSDFFIFDRLSELNEKVILTAEDYKDSNLKEIRARHGMLPAPVADKIKEVLPYIKEVFSDISVEEVLQIGVPVWNRSRFQGASGEPVVMLVPLIQAGKEKISGILIIEIDQSTGAISWQAESRSELLSPYLEARKVEPGQEYVRLLSVGAQTKLSHRGKSYI